MKNLQKGFIWPLLLAIVAVTVLGGGLYIYNKKIKTSSDTSVKLEDKNQGNIQKDVYYTSLPYAAIRANVANMSVWASIYFDKYHTYVGICDATNERAKAEGIDKFLESTLKIVSSADIYCNASATAYVYSLRMPDGNSWCADNIASLGSAISTSVKTLSCKNDMIDSNKVTITTHNQSTLVEPPVIVPAANQEQVAEDLQGIANIVASLSNFRSLAESVYHSSAGSYSSLCSNGLINVAANTSFSVIVKSILAAQGVSNQSSAGIVCAATKNKYALEVTFKKYVVSNGAYLSGKHSYCVDSAGVSGDDTRYKIDPNNYNCKMQ